MSKQSSSDPLEFVRNMWSNMGFTLPGMVTPTLDADELEQRITDMKAVEGWLRMNLNMLQASIQGLEVQAATLSTIRAMGDAVTQRPAGAAAPTGEMANPHPSRSRRHRRLHLRKRQRKMPRRKKAMPASPAPMPPKPLRARPPRLRRLPCGRGKCSTQKRPIRQRLRLRKKRPPRRRRPRNAPPLQKQNRARPAPPSGRPAPRRKSAYR